MGYHKREIKRGVYGELSKIQEELDELADAEEQDCILLQLIELSDLYGAIEGYLKGLKGGDFTMADLAAMSKLTGSAFEDGTRNAR